jgi:hypothetical protein
MVSPKQALKTSTFQLLCLPTSPASEVHSLLFSAEPSSHCTGSTGNICTVRCRNNAQAGPFGGCFPVQQTDITPNVNSANTITTAQTLEGVDNQIAENQIDLPVAIAANQNAGSGTAVQGLAAANGMFCLSC